MNIASPAFENNGRIPDKYTCFGQDVNPPLRFEDVPKDTASLILTVTDPDVPGKTFIHWLVYNIDPSETGVEEDSIPEGGIEGMNDFGEIGYSGPCPPTNTGTHHYHFTLYALDTELDFHEGALYEDIMDAIEPHVIDNAELIGTYSA